MTDKPDGVNILGKTYTITYCDRPSDVDHRGYRSLWGEIDHWKHSIRIYAPPEFSNGEVWDSLLHEVLHALAHELKLELGDSEEHVVGLLALGLSDTLVRNRWLSKDFRG